jgi:hypothetical protein
VGPLFFCFSLSSEALPIVTASLLCCNTHSFVILPLSMGDSGLAFLAILLVALVVVGPILAIAASLGSRTSSGFSTSSQNNSPGAIISCFTDVRALRVRSTTSFGA